MKPDELARLYASVDLVALSSEVEIRSMVGVEAMASGCPVLNTAIPHSGVPWVGRHDEAGLTVPVNNPQAFAAVARRLLDEPGLRDRLGRTARRQAVERFDHRAMAAHSLAIYRSAVG